MYDYFSIEGFKIFGLFYLCAGLPAFIYFWPERKKEKMLTIWFIKVIGTGIAIAALMYSFGYYFDVKNYKAQINSCENKEYVMIDRVCYKPIGNNHYIKADTVIVSLKKE